jgi:hypothetical protein
MKLKFQIGATVKTPTATGVVTNAAEFADHIEYLVELPDKTASWIHEEKLSAATGASE